MPEGRDNLAGITRLLLRCKPEVERPLDDRRRDSEFFRRFDCPHAFPALRDLAVEKGYAYLGKSGAGHFVKMVHNGIEYGMMQALAEGFAVMKASPFGLDLVKVADLYNHRSVIESRLVGWLKSAYEQYGPELADISGSVAQSGEGMWTVEAAKELGVQAPIIKGALDFRLESEKRPSYTGQIVSALRHQFGGHEVEVSPEKEEIRSRKAATGR